MTALASRLSSRLPADKRSFSMPSVDSIAEVKEAAIKSLQDASSSAAAAVDDGLQAASHAARSSAAFIKTNAERARDEGQARQDALRELVQRSKILRAALRLVGLATIRRARTFQWLPRLLCWSCISLCYS